jgi:putative flippase GtrA
VTSPAARPAGAPTTPATPPRGAAAGNGLRESLWQFARFCAVGGSGVVVNLIVFTLVLLVWLLVTGHIHSASGLAGAVHGLVVKRNTQGVPPVANYLANAAGFVVSVLTNYYLNRRWTFRSTKDVAGELPKFITVSVIAYAGQLGVFWLLREQAHLAPIPSQLIAIVFVMPINFVANKLWSFR